MLRPLLAWVLVMASAIVLPVTCAVVWDFTARRIRRGWWLAYKGDEVLFRPREWDWVSLLSEGAFPSLRAMDRFWSDFWVAVRS